MSNKAATKEEPEKPEITSENENSSPALNVRNDEIAFPSEHVPTFIIQDGPLIMNVNRSLERLDPSGGFFRFRYPESPYNFRRVAVEARLFGVTEVIYQNVKPLNKVQIWLDPSTADPQLTFENSGQVLTLAADQDLTIVGPVELPPGLPDRFTHAHPGTGGSNQIKKVIVRDQADQLMFADINAQGYTIFFFRAHD